MYKYSQMGCYKRGYLSSEAPHVALRQGQKALQELWTSMLIVSSNSEYYYYTPRRRLQTGR